MKIQFINQTGIVEIYCAIDLALEEGDLLTAFKGLERVYVLCQNNSIMLDGFAEYIHQKVGELLELGVITRVEQMLSLAEQAALQTDNHKLLLALSALKGQLFYENGRYDSACTVFEEVARQAERHEWVGLAAEAWYGLGVAERALKHLQKAGVFLRIAIELFAKTERQPQQAAALYMLGRVELEEGFVDNALIALEQAGAIWFHLDNYDELARVWYQQSQGYLEQNHYELALAKNDQVIELYQRQNLNLKWPLLNRVNIQFSLGRCEEAWNCLEECIQGELVEVESNYSDLLRIWRGILLAHQGNIKKGVEILDKSAEMYRKHLNYDMEAICLCLAGVYLWLAGEAENAKKRWERPITERHFRKRQLWLDGILKRCFVRMAIDFTLCEEMESDLDNQLQKAARLCGFEDLRGLLTGKLKNV